MNRAAVDGLESTCLSAGRKVEVRCSRMSFSVNIWLVRIKRRSDDFLGQRLFNVASLVLGPLGWKSCESVNSSKDENPTAPILLTDPGK